jgi:ABC-type Fe3+ transport system substrate-binding protein
VSNYIFNYNQLADIPASLRSTPRPESAKLFMAFITSTEFQKMLSAGGTAPTMLRSLDQQNKVANYDDNPQTNLPGFRIYDLDRRMADWWRMQYE